MCRTTENALISAASARGTLPERIIRYPVSAQLTAKNASAQLPKYVTVTLPL